MSQYILSIDLGTSGPKVAVYDAFGTLIVHTGTEITTQYLSGGGVEQNPKDWEESIDLCVKKILKENPELKSKIAAMNCTSQWSGTVALDKAGMPLAPAMIWMDSRGSKFQNILAKGLLPVAGYGLFKLIRWLQLTGGVPGHAGKDPISHILWIKNERPDIYNQTSYFLEPKDYINYYITGKINASYDSITLHWITDNRDLSNIDYSNKLLKLSGLNRKQFPDLLPPLTKLGKIRAELAQNWGLSENVICGVGTPDIHSALIGSGAVGDYEGHLYLGTSSWLTCHVPFKKVDLFHQMTSIPSAIPGRYMIANEQEAAGVCLRFLKQLLTPELPSSIAYKKFDEWAAQSKPGAQGLIFFPWLFGERTPVENHSLRSAFYNQSIRTTRDDYARAVLEGVALNSRWLLKYVEKYCGREFSEVSVVGGGANSDIWCQIYADIFNRKIVQPEDPLFANSRGAAILMSLTMGWVTPDVLKNKLKIRKTFTPNPLNKELYDRKFNIFLDFHKKNSGLFKRLNHA